MNRLTLLVGLAIAGLTPSACTEAPAIPASAFSLPIDFSYACEGAGQTVAPEIREEAARLADGRLCPENGASEGDLFGLVLNREPAGVVVLNIRADGSRAFIDSDFFVPGVTPIPVCDNPQRIIRASDYSEFYVLCGGADPTVTVLRLKDFGAVLDYETLDHALPGIPAAAVAVDGAVVIASADDPVLWVLQAGAGDAAPTVTELQLPARVLDIAHHDDELFVTWVGRPVLSRLAIDGTIVEEHGLVPACRDTLDNDGDGLVDRDDPDCINGEDSDESAVNAIRLTTVAESLGSDTVSLCENGIDDDGDGLTDSTDPACLDGGAGEGVAECGDGLDNNGDGLIDLADPGCYSEHQLFERALPSDGPHRLTVIDADGVGRWVYVLDQRLNEIAVFEDNPSGLERVAVNNLAPAEPPTLSFVPYSNPNAIPTESLAVPAIRSPSLGRVGNLNIRLTTSPLASLTSSRLRGQIWQRIIPATGSDQRASVPFDLPSTRWTPEFCDADQQGQCFQPFGDDKNWYAFGPRIDGRLQLIEVVSRGVPVHRVVQGEDDIEDRGLDVSGPRLTLRDRFIAGRGEPQALFPFIGAGIEELIESAEVNVAPAKVRRFGIWPADEAEEVINESWSVTFEGPIPGASGSLGRLTAADTLTDPNATFCEDGVAVGDWLQLEAPTAGTPTDLVHTVDVVTDDGEACPTLTPAATFIELPVTAVGSQTLTFDPSAARLRAPLPELDEDAIDAANISLRACQESLNALELELGLPENLRTTSSFSAANLPSRVRYTARVAEWAVVGGVSGFLHRQAWDREAGSCVEDTSLDARLTGRAGARSLDVGDYLTCPPRPERLELGAVEQLTGDSGPSFVNPSIGIDIFPACDVDDNGQIVTRANQQDTRWSFSIVGPNDPASIAVDGSLLGVRVPMLDFRRQQVQLDASASRASLLEVRPGTTRVITVFE